MPSIIRNSGYAWIWTCKTVVDRDGKRESCDVFNVADTEAAARRAYDAHKKAARH